MKSPNVLELNGAVAPIVKNPSGFPLIASLFANGYGNCGEYLCGDGRICNPTRQGGNFRDAKDTDMVFDGMGRLSPAMGFVQ